MLREVLSGISGPNDMHFCKLNEEVLISADPITTVNREDIEVLKARALKNRRNRIRFCAHQDIEDKVHEMLIVHMKDLYARPHRHLDKSESYHIIEGELDIVLFREDGSIETVVHMGDINSERQFYYRLSDSLYHTIIVRSDMVVFQETTTGPFNRKDTIFAPWSPEESMIDAAEEYLYGLIVRIERNLH